MKLADGRELITVLDAAKMLGVTRGRVSHFLSDGRLGFVKLKELPGRTFLVKADVKNFVKKRKGVLRTKGFVRKESFKIPW